MLAFIGGPAVLRAEAILLTGLVFLGFNAAWLLLFDSGPDSRRAAPAQSTAPAAAESARRLGGYRDNADGLWVGARLAVGITRVAGVYAVGSWA